MEGGRESEVGWARLGWLTGVCHYLELMLRNILQRVTAMCVAYPTNLKIRMLVPILTLRFRGDNFTPTKAGGKKTGVC